MSSSGPGRGRGRGRAPGNKTKQQEYKEWGKRCLLPTKRPIFTTHTLYSVHLSLEAKFYNSKHFNLT